MTSRKGLLFDPMQTLRIFISSPSDVRAERVRAYDVVQRLQTKFRAFIKVEPILWEDEPMRATSSFQAQIPKPSETDVVICVLWARIGTRLPHDYRRADGSVPTGTEWEFEDAYESYKARKTPDLLVYRKTAPPEITVTSDEMLEEWQQQKKALDVFLARWFQDHEGGFKAAFNTFATDEDFGNLLSSHLEKVVTERLRDVLVPISWTEGSPYRGLEVFQAEHQKIFFGRDLAIVEISQRLIEQSQRGRVFLTLLGMSGCGKSSLVRAGVIPELTRPGVVQAVGCWRWAILRPSESSGTLIDGLASALFSEKSALPELARLGYDATRLAALLQDAPTHAIPLIEAGLNQAAQQFAADNLREKPPVARFILVIDQLEEIFTIERFDASQRAAFISAISTLSRSGLVWVIATMRSDLYGRCAEMEAFRTLKSDDGQYDLSPPSVSEIGQIIRMPAMAAGLQFEVHPVTRQKLDDVLQEQASKNPEALPLLEFCLDELYNRRTESRLVTWEAYEELGGLNGAIAKRAEDVFAELSASGKEAFPRVLAALLTVDATATSRPARHKELSVGPSEEEVVSAFTRANLFVTDVDQAGEPTVALAHEALINSWPRVQDWVQENKDFLRLKTRLAQAGHRWRESGKDRDFLLPEGKPLAEAEDALRKRRAELNEIEFVLASVKYAAHRRRMRAFTVAGVLTLVLSIIFGSIILRNIQQRHTTSETDFALAVEEMGRNEISLSLAYLADALRKNPRNEKAIALTVAELRDSLLPLSSLHHEDEVQDANFSDNGALIVTASADGTAGLWNAQSGNPIRTLRGHRNWVHTARFSPDGKLVVTASWDGTAKIWETSTGNAICTLDPHAGKVFQANFSPDGTRVVTASEGNSAQLWNVKTCQPAGPPMQHSGKVWTARFSPDGNRVVTASEHGVAKVWDISTGVAVQKLELTGHDKSWDVNSAVFSPDGNWIATAADDNTAALWDARTGKRCGLMKHNGSVNFVSFSFDKPTSLVVTASSDQTARIWQLPKGGSCPAELTPVGSPMRHRAPVRAAAFSHDGRWVITASYDRTARVWDTKGLPAAEPLRHNGGVYIASFSPNDSSIVTASFDHTARIWPWQQIPQLRPMPHCPSNGGTGYGTLLWAAFGRDSRTVAMGFVGGVCLWDAGAEKGASVPVTLRQVRSDELHYGPVFSPSGGQLLTSYENGTELWDSVTGRAAGRCNLPPAVSNATFTSEGAILAVSKHQVSLLDASSCKQLIKLSGDGFQGAVFSPSKDRIVTYSADGTILFWDAATGNPIPGTNAKHNGVVSVARFSPDGRFVVTASSDHTARIWNAHTGQPVGNPLQHSGWVYDAAFSPDGNQVVTASNDDTAQIWDVKSFQPATPPLRQGGEVMSAKFSPDGRWVITAAADGSAQVWDAATGVAVGRPILHGSRVVSASFSPDGKWILTASEDGRVRISDAPITASRAPSWLIELAEAVGGLSLDDKGRVQPRSEDPAVIRQRLTQLPITDDVARFGRWLATEEGNRPFSPREE
jgi:WD40 repeat protein